MWKKQKGWGERKRYGIGAIVWQETVFAGVYFCGLASFCVLRELIFAIFFIPGEIIDDIFVFIEYVQWKYTFSNILRCAHPL